MEITCGKNAFRKNTLETFNYQPPERRNMSCLLKRWSEAIMGQSTKYMTGG